MYDRIIYEGAEYGLAAAPLGAFFKENPERAPRFNSFSAGCRRGYAARWEVRDNKIYLVGMDMVCETESTFQSIFPGAGDGLFAYWISGELVCSRGKMVSYDHAGFARKREYELTLTAERGTVVSSTTRDNRKDGAP
jgi:hypothetical protein